MFSLGNLNPRFGICSFSLANRVGCTLIVLHYSHGSSMYPYLLNVLLIMLSVMGLVLSTRMDLDTLSLL